MDFSFPAVDSSKRTKTENGSVHDNSAPKTTACDNKKSGAATAPDSSLPLQFNPFVLPNTPGVAYVMAPFLVQYVPQPMCHPLFPFAGAPNVFSPFVNSPQVLGQMIPLTANPGLNHQGSPIVPATLVSPGSSTLSRVNLKQENTAFSAVSANGAVAAQNDTETVHCSCQKAHCLKLLQCKSLVMCRYCDCLRSGNECSSECNCRDCFNRRDRPEREQALLYLKKREKQNGNGVRPFCSVECRNRTAVLAVRARIVFVRRGTASAMLSTRSAPAGVAVFIATIGSWLFVEFIGPMRPIWPPLIRALRCVAGFLSQITPKYLCYSCMSVSGCSGHPTHHVEGVWLTVV